MPTKTWVDPIVEEVHAIRKQMLEECGGDLELLAKQLEDWQEKHPERMSEREAMPLKELQDR